MSNSNTALIQGEWGQGLTDLLKAGECKAEFRDKVRIYSCLWLASAAGKNGKKY